MKNSRNSEELWEALVEDAAPSDLRETIFHQTLCVARGRRRRRTGLIVAGLLIPVIVFLAVTTSTPPFQAHRTATPPTDQPKTIVQKKSSKVASKPEIISDEELFAMFPDHALALVGPPGEQQLVILGQRQ